MGCEVLWAGCVEAPHNTHNVVVELFVRIVRIVRADSHCCASHSGFTSNVGEGGLPGLPEGGIECWGSNDYGQVSDAP